MKLLWVYLLKNRYVAMKCDFYFGKMHQCFKITIEIMQDNTDFQYFLALSSYLLFLIFKYKTFYNRSGSIAYSKIPLKIRFGIPFYAHNMYQKVLFYCHFTIYVMWYIWALYYIYYRRQCSRRYAEGNDGKMDCTSDMYYQLKRE